MCLVISLVSNLISSLAILIPRPLTAGRRDHGFGTRQALAVLAADSSDNVWYLHGARQPDSALEEPGAGTFDAVGENPN